MPLLFAFLTRQSRFCFGCCSFGIVGLLISGAESRSREVAIGFFGYFLWKVLINFQRYMTVNEGFKCFLVLDCSFIKRGNKSLAFSHYYLPVGRISRFQWLLWTHIPCCHWPQIPNSFLALVELCPLAFSSWCPSLTMTREIHCVFSTW